MIAYVISWLRQSEGAEPSNGVSLTGYGNEEEAKVGLVRFLEEERDLWISSPEDEANLTISINEDGKSGVLHDRWYTNTVIATILDVDVV